MPDETVISPEEAVVAEPQYIGSEGELKEGWQNAYVPEDIRKDGTWSRFKKIQDVIKSENEARKLVSKKGVILPTEASKPEEWDAFYRLTGKPEKPEDYDIKKPDDFPDDYWDEEFSAAAAQEFHKMHLTKKQAAALLVFDNQRVLNGLKKMKEENDTAELALRKEAGTKYDEIFHQGKRLLTENLSAIPQELQQNAINDLNKAESKPYLFFLLGAIQGKFDDDTLMSGGKLPGSLGIDQQIEALRSDPAYLDMGNKAPLKHKEIIEKINKLTEQKLAMQSKG